MHTATLKKTPKNVNRNGCTINLFHAKQQVLRTNPTGNSRKVTLTSGDVPYCHVYLKNDNNNTSIYHGKE